MPTSHRARLLAVAHALLMELDPADAEVFSVEVKSRGGTVLLFETVGEFAPEYELLSDQERAVVRVLLDAADHRTEQIATLTGYSDNSRLRAVLAALQAKNPPIIETCNGGYRRVRP